MGQLRLLCVVVAILITCKSAAADKCPAEPGYCVRSSGWDQNGGVIKVNSADGNTAQAQAECLKHCHDRAGATGCEVIWSRGNRGCYIHTRDIAYGNGRGNHMCWVFSKCKTDDYDGPMDCPMENGYCVTSSGRDQNRGVVTISRRDGGSADAQAECLKSCQATPGATGCEVIYNRGNRGCYVHKGDIARGNNRANHKCWVFSKCKPARVDGGYSPWSDFTPCSTSCGVGEQKRTRSCTNPTPSGGGLDCTNLGDATQVEQCKLAECPVDGGYGPWSEFSACSTTCGDGLKHRSRQCNQPAPEHGGRNCNHLGYAKEDAVCNLGECCRMELWRTGGCLQYPKVKIEGGVLIVDKLDVCIQLCKQNPVCDGFVTTKDKKKCFLVKKGCSKVAGSHDRFDMWRKVDCPVVG